MPLVEAVSLFSFPRPRTTSLPKGWHSLSNLYTPQAGRLAARWLIHGRLNGRKHTIPRAELRAVQCSLAELPPAEWQVLTDHENHVCNAEAGRVKCMASGLSDLWQETWEAVDLHEKIDFRHVYSHRDDKLARDLAAGRIPLHFLGNVLADIAAGLDEQEAVMTWATTETITIVDGLGLKVMKRPTAIAL